MSRAQAPIERLEAKAFRVPTDAPESDGTLQWDATGLMTVTLDAGGKQGFGYGYAGRAARDTIDDVLAPVVAGKDAFDIPAIWSAMVASVRNAGWRGVSACAISAVDAALWDLKAKLLDLPLVEVARGRRATAWRSTAAAASPPTRISGCANSFPAGCNDLGCRAVKMKIGREPGRDPARMEAARDAIGDAELYIDANGAFTAKQALAMAEKARAFGVTWFEEPVSSDDLGGLRLVRERGPAGMDVAAGEYGYDPFYFRRMLEAAAVDVLQADATRCGGITGFLKAAELADAHGVPLSAHTAPALHLSVACAAPRMKNVEWFHDHVRIEHMLMDGAPSPADGADAPRSVATRQRPRIQVGRRGTVRRVSSGDRRPGEYRCPIISKSITASGASASPRRAGGCLPSSRRSRKPRDRQMVRELEGAIEGDVHFDAGSRALYATDASNYRQVPLGVVFPKTDADVEAAVAACRRHGAALVLRGGGTSLAGQGCNVAVLLDFLQIHERHRLDRRRCTAGRGCSPAAYSIICATAPRSIT